MSDELERKNIDKTKIDWNEHAEYWDDFDDAKDYTKNIIRLLSERVDLENMTILDFGCGTGLLTDYMTKKAKQIVALDTSSKMIEVLKSKNYGNVKTINDELSSETIKGYPSLQQKFDLIVAVSVCNFLPDYLGFLSIIKSLLKPNGIFIQWDWLQKESDDNFGFTEQMIEENYQQVGLKIDSINVPFYMIENEEKMEVLMVIGKL